MNVPKTTSRDQIVAHLKELELSTYEATVYATLITHPTMTASALCKETGIPDTKIYYALEGLNEKGMLTIRQGNPKIYRPNPPKEAIAKVEEYRRHGCTCPILYPVGGDVRLLVDTFAQA